MKLVIQGNHSFEKLEELAQLFTGIENKDVVLPHLGEPEMPYTEANLG